MAIIDLAEKSAGNNVQYLSSKWLTYRLVCNSVTLKLVLKFYLVLIFFCKWATSTSLDDVTIPDT